MASYTPIDQELSFPAHHSPHKIPRKKVASEVVVGLEAPSPEGPHTYTPLCATSEAQHDSQDSLSATSLVREHSPFRWWSMEILSCIAGVGCLAAIVALLAIYDRKPQKSWSSNVITLNGLVALLATLCRTFIMVAISAALAQGKWNQLSSRNDGSGYRLRDFALFNDAAKGPWGSLQLIWRFKGLHIACVGAALSILSLAFGLFTQQLIGLEIIELEGGLVADNARVSRATWIDTMRWGTAPTRPLISSDKLSIYDGYMAATINIPQVNCPTGKCTWPIIPTVGVCGACVNITDKIQVSNPPSGPNCTVSTPGGIQLRGCDIDFEGVKFAVGAGSGEVFSSVPGAPAGRQALNVITEFGALGILPSVGLSASITTSHATECALWYCVQARKVTVHDGELRDDIVETWNRLNETFPHGILPFIDIPASFNLDPNETYSVAQTQMDTIQRYFNETINGTIKFWSIISNPTTDFVDALHKSFDNPDAWIDRFARSMTNEIRWLGRSEKPESSSVENQPQLSKAGRSTPSENVRYQGTVFSDQVIVTVRWVWLIYPAGMLVLAVLYLIFEATRTSFQKDVRPWKDDSIVPLCINLDERLREVARAGLIEPKGGQKLVGDQNVRVTRGEHGFPAGFTVKADQ